MRPALTLPGLFHSDPDYVPFGTRWLRGLTPARVRLLVAFCAVFSVRQDNFVSGPLLESFQYLAVQVFCYLPMLLLVTIADNITFGASNRRRVAGFAAAVLIGAAIYALICVPYLYLLGTGPEWLTTVWLLSYFNRAFLYGLLTATLYFITRERAMQVALHRTQMTKLSLDPQMTEAHLQAVQAQIEPHFLFNTLAHVKRLYQTDRLSGRTMLDKLMQYLTAIRPLRRRSH